jgi:hypothetical protein
MGTCCYRINGKAGWDANTFPFLTPGDLDMSSIISIPTLFVFDLTDEWELLTSSLSTALTTLEIMEADFAIMASVGHSP